MDETLGQALDRLADALKNKPRAILPQELSQIGDGLRSEDKEVAGTALWLLRRAVYQTPRIVLEHADVPVEGKIALLRDNSLLSSSASTDLLVDFLLGQTCARSEEVSQATLGRMESFLKGGQLPGNDRLKRIIGVMSGATTSGELAMDSLRPAQRKNAFIMLECFIELGIDIPKDFQLQLLEAVKLAASAPQDGAALDGAEYSLRALGLLFRRRFDDLIRDRETFCWHLDEAELGELEGAINALLPSVRGNATVCECATIVGGLSEEIRSWMHDETAMHSKPAEPSKKAAVEPPRPPEGTAEAFFGELRDEVAAMDAAHPGRYSKRKHDPLPDASVMERWKPQPDNGNGSGEDTPLSSVLRTFCEGFDPHKKDTLPPPPGERRRHSFVDREAVRAALEARKKRAGGEPPACAAEPVTRPEAAGAATTNGLNDEDRRALAAGFPDDIQRIVRKLRQQSGGRERPPTMLRLPKERAG